MKSNSLRVVYKTDGSFADIIHTIGKWKVIDLPNLHKQLNVKIGYRTLKAKINDLQRDGVVAHKFLGASLKYVYLTDKGIVHTPFDKTYQPVSEEVTHDLLVGRVAQELSQRSKVAGVTMYHLIEDKHINPDAIITVNGKNTVFNIGIEIELTRKSQRRIKSKFGKYGTSQDYDYCFYISNDERLLKSYRRYLNDLEVEIQKKFFFITDENLKNAGEILKDVSCIYKDKEADLDAVIGEKLL